MSGISTMECQEKKESRSNGWGSDQERLTRDSASALRAAKPLFSDSASVFLVKPRRSLGTKPSKDSTVWTCVRGPSSARSQTWMARMPSVAPDQAILDWADQLLTTYSNRRAIVAGCIGTATTLIAWMLAPTLAWGFVPVLANFMVVELVLIAQQAELQAQLQALDQLAAALGGGQDAVHPVVHAPAPEVAALARQAAQLLTAG